jgi:DNA uptake protein ComE-like DNA-binding protein
MERAWPLAIFYAIAVIWLTLSPAPRAFRFTPTSAWAAVRVSAPDLSPEQLLLADIKLDITRASVAALRALPEVGEGLAQRIVATRQQTGLRCEADLLRVPGLSAARLARLLPFLKGLPKRCSLPQQRLEYLP